MTIRVSSTFRAGAACLVASAWLAGACQPELEPGCANADGACWCDAMFEPREPVSECSEKTMGGPVVCCDDGDKCECGLYYCDPSSGSCLCNYVGVENPPATSCTGTVCCTDPGKFCRCSSSACTGSDVLVASCTTETALCDAGETRVEKCRPRD